MTVVVEQEVRLVGHSTMTLVNLHLATSMCLLADQAGITLEEARSRILEAMRFNVENPTPHP